MPYLADRVQETSSTSGTGTFTLAGAVSDYRSFSTAFGTGFEGTVAYTADDGAGHWEVGLGTYTQSTLTLSRSEVLSSSNAGALTSFPTVGFKVWCDAPASNMGASQMGLTYATARGVSIV